ncbi:MAG: hypothetical protein CHACPFDD_00232 [Phycisphaerae bacterium]|nr:hypothetical protein [Phycisphaerae bacterium]
MSSNALALHLCTGDRALEQAADASLSERAWSVLEFENVYSAAAHFCRQREPAPRLVLIGLDWLADDEREIVRRARQTWPDAVIATYGLTVWSASDVRAVVQCRTVRDIAALLSGIETSATNATIVPRDLPEACEPAQTEPPPASTTADLAQFERTGDLDSFLAGVGEADWSQELATPGGAGSAPAEHDAAGAVAEKPGEPSPPAAGATGGAKPHEAAGESPAAAEPGLPPVAEGTFLTREELTALLGGKE